MNMFRLSTLAVIIPLLSGCDDMFDVTSAVVFGKGGDAATRPATVADAQSVPVPSQPVIVAQVDVQASVDAVSTMIAPVIPVEVETTEYVERVPVNVSTTAAVQIVDWNDTVTISPDVIPAPIRMEPAPMFNENGFDIDGYDILGFDIDGYDASGYDVDGFQRDGSGTVAFNKDINPGGIGWADSYTVNGVCYIMPGLDHGVSDVIYHDAESDFNGWTVKVIQQTIPGPGVEHADALFNTVHCGHGPDNGFWDEIAGACPGRVDMGAGEGCGIVGPKWVYPN